MKEQKLRTLCHCGFGFICILMIGALFFIGRQDSMIEEKDAQAAEREADAAKQEAQDTKESATEQKEKHRNGDYDYSEPVPESAAVKKSYFDDALFIGDSRTEGFMLNAGLSNATFYSHKGITVKTVFTEPAIKIGKSRVSIMDAVDETEFSKVYIMLGINEIGWVYSSTFIDKYGEIVDRIREHNPDAVIYIQQILPVSQKVSKEHSYIKNKRIRKYNALLQKLAEEKQVYYVDVAKAVENDKGVLPKEAAVDGIHLKKDYCLKWLEYLQTHTVE